MVSFSTRTAWNLDESALAAAIRAARASGQPLLDLTISNPTVCGFDYAPPAILAPLADPRSLVYDPDPRGILSAREAVAAYYADHAAPVAPGRILLTTSTSEAYAFLFRLLCNSGDHVLAAQPSYPLFDFLADLEDVCLGAYPLFYDFGWWIDHAELERRITPRTRAILLVHPNNPTGHATSLAERERLEQLCLRHNLALIVDEVFLDYGIESPIRSLAQGPHPVLTFVVSGLSKICGLPQMKVAWLAAFGPEADLDPALARLEVIADTFLSMNAPAQRALPTWLAGRHTIQRQILTRVRQNLASARAALDVLHVEAGWSAILRLPQRSSMTSDSVPLQLLRDTGVVVHPGAFYGISPRDSHRVVISLLGDPITFSQAVDTLKRYFEPA